MLTKHYVCFCCGKYFIDSEAKNKKKYCSQECEKKYSKCSVCGEYYIIDEEVDKKKHICSKECNKNYKIKKLKRREKLDFSDLT